ncbi:type II toxin-antitoxin system MqsA family antitoxin [Nostoc sp. CHAB 5824]|nr:type II toxin-antitoxin system MqsA family antitoxin [Nostoc sp. CHAB 5824]
MLCDLCRVKVSKSAKLLTITYGKGKDLLVIENIPVITCTHCGESYLTAESLHKIEQIKTNLTKLAVERPVEVASFGS